MSHRTAEYGDPDVAEDFASLLKISPLHSAPLLRLFHQTADPIEPTLTQTSRRRDPTRRRS